MKLAESEIKKVVTWGKGQVVFLTRELKELKADKRVLVTVEKDKKGEFIRIRKFDIPS